MNSMKSSNTIATISLKQPIDDLLKSIHNACIDTGFFYLVDHDIDHTLITNTYTQAEKFFDLPYEIKRQCLLNEYYRGYSPMYDVDKNSKDRKEGFYLGFDYTNHVLYDSNPFYGHNAYPDTTVLPDFKETVIQYHSAMQNLAGRITPLIFQSLGINDNDNPYYQSNTFQQQFNALRLIHYPGVSSQQPTITLSDGEVDTIYGNGAHTDSGFITILSTDTNTGLQIRTQENKWIYVPHKPDAFIINLGDMLNAWTNGIYTSTMHRVIRPPGSTTRYSIPFFYNPQFDAVVKPLDICTTPDQPAKYAAVTCGRHIFNEFEKGLLRVTPELQQRTKRGNEHEYPQDEVVTHPNMTAASKYDMLLNSSNTCGEAYQQQCQNTCGEAYYQQTNSTCGEAYQHHIQTGSCGEAYKQQLG